MGLDDLLEQGIISSDGARQAFKAARNPLEAPRCFRWPHLGSSWLRAFLKSSRKTGRQARHHSVNFRSGPLKRRAAGLEALRLGLAHTLRLVTHLLHELQSRLHFAECRQALAQALLR